MQEQAVSRLQQCFRWLVSVSEAEVCALLSAILVSNVLVVGVNGALVSRKT